MKHILLFFLVIISQTVASQEIIDDTILSKIENIKWMNNFEKLSLKSDKILKVKQKIIADTLFKQANKYSRIIFMNNKNTEEVLPKVACECKILFVLVLNDKSYYLLDPVEYPSTLTIVKQLSNVGIKDIYTVKNTNAAALYGEYAKCGVVLLISDNSKLKKTL